MRVFTFCVIALCIAVKVSAQLTVSHGIDSAAVHTLLAHPSLQISNITMNCDATAYGEFSGRSELPMTHGLYVSTGKGSDLFSQNLSESTSTAFGTTDTIQGLPSTRDVCAIEYDVRSSENTLSFIYSFGSEEYPEYVNSPFNDVFVILIRGPRPAGGTYNNVNIAMLPDFSNTCINHVNPQQNDSLFYDNTFPQGYFVSADGLTAYIRAAVDILPDSLYHITIAIGDRDDPFFDSAGFLAAEDSDNHALPIMPPSGIDCFPNPVSDLLSWLPATGLEIKSAVLYDAAGRVVYIVEDPNEQRSIDVSQYARGFYVLRIEATFFTYTFRVVKS